MRQTEGTITENFEVILEANIAETMRRLRVGTLARVISVENNLLSVQPIIKEKINTATGYKYIMLPEIHNVYSVMGQSPSVGDYVICVHFDRGIEDFDIFTNKTGFIESGVNRHSLQDCVAIVINSNSEFSGWQRLGEYSSNNTVDEIKDCSEIKIHVLSEGIQIRSDAFYRADGVNLLIAGEVAGDTYSIAIDLDSGVINVSNDFSVVIYIKK